MLVIGSGTAGRLTRATLRPNLCAIAQFEVAEVNQSGQYSAQAQAAQLTANEPRIDPVKAEAQALLVQQGARVRHFRKKAGLTIEQLAEKAGMHFNTLGRIERGAVEATTQQLLSLARSMGVEPRKLAHYADEARDAPQAAGDDYFVVIDMIDLPTASGAADSDDGTLVRFSFQHSWLVANGISPGRTRVLIAQGDSMRERIKDGDVLLVDTSFTSLQQDGVYVILLGGKHYVKVLQRDFGSGGVRVVSYNPAYPVQELTADQAAELVICGRVVWHGGEL